jgi:molecular chaperone DnaJ
MPLKKSVIDAFNVFGLSPDEEYSVAAKAYKTLAFKHHPDRNHGDHTATERFQKVFSTYYLVH